MRQVAGRGKSHPDQSMAAAHATAAVAGAVQACACLASTNPKGMPAVKGSTAPPIAPLAPIGSAAIIWGNTTRPWPAAAPVGLQSPGASQSGHPLAAWQDLPEGSLPSLRLVAAHSSPAAPCGLQTLGGLWADQERAGRRVGKLTLDAKKCYQSTPFAWARRISAAAAAAAATGPLMGGWKFLSAEVSPPHATAHAHCCLAKLRNHLMEGAAVLVAAESLAWTRLLLAAAAGCLQKGPLRWAVLRAAAGLA